MTATWKVVDQNAFEQKIENLVVLARANPEHKLLLAAGLKAMEKKVAIIGDSNNDIKSFGSAHVSICMGSGSAIAKQSCDIVLLDDDFFDAINAVMYGRNIFTNIKRFLMFQITANFSTIIVIFISFLYLTESPISSTQLLWINLIIDTFAALALATMPPMNSVLREPANHSEASILEKCQWRQIYGVTIWNTIIMCIIIFGGKALFDLDYTNSTQMTEHGDDGKLTQGAIDKRTHFTIIYNVFIQLIWFNEWNCRVVNPTEKNIFKKFFSSWTFLFVMVGIAAMQWSSVKWLAWLFECEVLSPTLFFRCVAYGFTVIPFAFMLKLTPASWVDRIPVGISENSALGKNSFIMKGYDAANSKRKIVVVKKGPKDPQAE
jgi:Ca2+ transporting ATPase